jgi:hypothetical protein
LSDPTKSQIYEIFKENFEIMVGGGVRTTCSVTEEKAAKEWKKALNIVEIEAPNLTIYEFKKWFKNHWQKLFKMVRRGKEIVSQVDRDFFEFYEKHRKPRFVIFTCELILVVVASC